MFSFKGDGCLMVADQNKLWPPAGLLMETGGHLKGLQPQHSPCEETLQAYLSSPVWIGSMHDRDTTEHFQETVNVNG